MMNHIISIADFSREGIQELLFTAKEIKQQPPQPFLQGKIMASCFFEPSTRTRLSFETAMLRLGGNVIGFSDGHFTSMQKGETLFDSIKVIGSYADVIVLRHPMDGAARLATVATDKPVINAGDGTNQHPTQTLVDLFTIQEMQGRIDRLQIGFFGDLKYARTAHSLALATALFETQLFFVAPDTLHLPDHLCHELRKKGVKFSFHQTLSDIIRKIDILYVTRPQRERYEKDIFYPPPLCLKEELLAQAKPNLKILHPLPRVDEIERSIDCTPFAGYFEQSANGIVVRQALFKKILGQI
jgi:aspartate carbamoyltransferase catalytic subunit